MKYQYNYLDFSFKDKFKNEHKNKQFVWILNCLNQINNVLSVC